MTPADHDDDPTHALDDFVRRMRQPAAAAGRAPEPVPDLSGFGTHQQAPSERPMARGGVLRSGQRWHASDVDDVPVAPTTRPTVADSSLPQVTLPPVQHSPPPDGAMLIAATRRARDLAAAQHESDNQAASQPAWQPNPAALQLRPAANPRLLPHWQPQAWVAALRQVMDSNTVLINTADGPVVETHPPQRLLLLWPPQGDGRAPGRWPQQTQLLGLSAAEAGAAALALLPEGAALWLLPDGAAPGNLADVDWALAAELVLHHQAGLQPFQMDGLRALIANEREAVFARLNSGYQQHVAGGAVVRP